LYNEKVIFNATADEDYEFIKWKGDLIGNGNPQTINITKNLSIEAVFKTVKEALVYNWGGRVYINVRVQSATLQLFNTLPQSVNLVRIKLKNQNGNLVVENTDGAIINSGSGINFEISFGIQPTIEDFKNYTVEWEVTYKGKNYIKINKVGSSTKSKKNKIKVSKTIKSHVTQKENHY